MVPGNARRVLAPDEGNIFVSRLWSRFSVRAISIVLLLVGVAGGVYLGHDREIQQQGIDAQLAVEANLAERQVLRERESAHAAAIAPQREAESQASAKAADAAKAAARRADKVQVAVSRKQEREKTTGAGGTTKPGAGSEKAKPFPGPIPASCNVYSGNRKTGCAILVQQGFKLDQMACLDKLWSRESGWNHKAYNGGSGATGIPQALPGSKMASAGADWKTNPATQIRWGLGYIKSRYKTPCAAWGHSERDGWY